MTTSISSETFEKQKHKVKKRKILDLDVRCYMNLWGVAVLELDCHPDHNKGQTTHLALVHRLM